MAQRLSKENWLHAGFDALIEAGPTALKAEPLARRLGTTKGSFYWHFTDVAGFHAAMMTLWERHAVEQIAALVARGDTPVTALRHIADIHATDALGLSDGIALEAAIRAWARDSRAVAASLHRVDANRLDFLKGLLANLGLTNPELTHLVYAACVGMEALTGHENADPAATLGTLVDLILALHEAD